MDAIPSGSKAGRLLDGVTYDALPDRPVTTAPDRRRRLEMIESPA
jgi:hypothetical protein